MTETPERDEIIAIFYLGGGGSVTSVGQLNVVGNSEIYGENIYFQKANQTLTASFYVSKNGTSWGIAAIVMVCIPL